MDIVVDEKPGKAAVHRPANGNINDLRMRRDVAHKYANAKMKTDLLSIVYFFIVQNVSLCKGKH
jgi:hypothetical protein